MFAAVRIFSSFSNHAPLKNRVDMREDALNLLFMIKLSQLPNSVCLICFQCICTNAQRKEPSHEKDYPNP